MKLTRFLAPLSINEAAAAESIGLPLLLVGIGMWLNPIDVLWTRSSFPWSWIAPIILALRYGLFSGLTGALCLFGAWVVLSPVDLEQADFPETFFLGGLILTMLCGEFSSIWRARVKRAESMQFYLDQRLEYLTYQHYLLRLSHDRLEQEMIVRPVSMRDALAALRNLTATANEALPGGTELLRLLAQYCQIETAALYTITAGKIETAATASIGSPFELIENDPLVRFALNRNCLSHIQSVKDDNNSENYLIASPLTTRLGNQHGLLVVTKMPFFALHEETLQILNLLLGYYADGLDSREVAQPILTQYPDCPYPFAFELSRLWHIRVNSGVKSAIVALIFTSLPNDEDLLPQIHRQSRSLDVTWAIERPQRNILITLMPLASSAGAEGYLARIDAWAKRQLDMTLVECGVITHVFFVDETEPITLIKRLRIACGDL